MSSKPKCTFLRRRYTDGQKAYEKMLSIINYKRNANESYNEFTTAQWSESPSLKSLQISAGKGVEKKVLSDIAGGNVNWYSLYGG